MDLDVEGGGSITFKREDVDRGFEPDECFYFRDIEIVLGKRDVDLDAEDAVVRVDTLECSNLRPLFLSASRRIVSIR